MRTLILVSLTLVCGAGVALAQSRAARDAVPGETRSPWYMDRGAAPTDGAAADTARPQRLRLRDPDQCQAGERQTRRLRQRDPALCSAGDEVVRGGGQGRGWGCDGRGGSGGGRHGGHGGGRGRCR
jgi:hypothetical protein